MRYEEASRVAEEERAAYQRWLEGIASMVASRFPNPLTESTRVMADLRPLVGVPTDDE